MIPKNVRASRLRACVSISFMLVALLLPLGYLSPFVIQAYLHRQMLQAIIWRPDSPPDVDARHRGQPGAGGANPTFLRVWLFNVTNVDDIRRGAKPRLEEVGPFVYLKRREVVDAWWDWQGRVAVKTWEYNLFQPSLSAAPLDANITNVNLPLLGVLEQLHAAAAGSSTAQALLDVLLGFLAKWNDPRVNGLFTTRPAADLIWGYEDALLRQLTALLPAGYVRTTRVELIHNGTLQEAQELEPTLYNTGVHDLRQIWNVESQNGWTNVTSWGPGCEARVAGSDGSQFAPGVDPSNPLRIWIAGLFRSALMQYLGPTSLHDIRLLRYQLSPHEWDPNPCRHQNIPGLLNITVPMSVGPNGNISSSDAHSVPLLPSMPHLCRADPRVTDQLEGLTCEPERHTCYLDVEPITGITMRGSQRIQVNSQLTNGTRMHLEPKINRSLILPIFWTDESSEMSELQAYGFKNTVYFALALARLSRLWAWTASAVCLAVGAVWAVFLSRSRSDGDGENEPLLQPAGGDDTPTSGVPLDGFHGWRNGLPPMAGTAGAVSSSATLEDGLGGFTAHASGAGVVGDGNRH